MVELTRRATFSASHFYWNDAWPAEKNEQVFGRCANRNGHGHNYTLEVTVAGEPDPVTGFVVDLKWLKDLIGGKIMTARDPPPLHPPPPSPPRCRGLASGRRSHLRDAGDFCRVSRGVMKAYFGRRYTLSA